MIKIIATLLLLYKHNKFMPKGNKPLKIEKEIKTKKKKRHNDDYSKNKKNNIIIIIIGMTITI